MDQPGTANMVFDRKEQFILKFEQINSLAGFKRINIRLAERSTQDVLESTQTTKGVEHVGTIK